MTASTGSPVRPADRVGGRVQTCNTYSRVQPGRFELRVLLSFEPTKARGLSWANLLDLLTAPDRQ